MIATTPVCDTSNWFGFICNAIQSRDHSGLVGPLVQNLLSAVAIFIVLYLVGRLTRLLVLWAMRRGRADRQVRTLVRNLITVTTYVVAVISALVVYGVNVAVILTAAGVGTVAIGLAFQDLLRNVLAGIWLLLEQPFRLGDTITVLDQTGHAFSARKREEGRFEVREELTAASANAAPASHCKSKTSGADSRVREGEVSGEYEGSRLGAMDDYPRNINELGAFIWTMWRSI